MKERGKSSVWRAGIQARVVQQETWRLKRVRLETKSVGGRVIKFEFNLKK